jgi:UrcA family protein
MLKSLLPALAGAGLAALATAPGSARAQTAAPTVQSASVRISYADLNLSNPAGARKMMGRIHHAARAICGEPDSNNDLAGWAQQRACVEITVSDALRSLDNPTVTAFSERNAATFVASR